MFHPHVQLHRRGRTLAAAGIASAALFSGAAALPSDTQLPVVSQAAPQEAEAFLRIRIPTSCDSFWGQFMKKCPRRYA